MGVVVGVFLLIVKFGMFQGFDFFDDELMVLLEDFWGDCVLLCKKFFFDECLVGIVNDVFIFWIENNVGVFFFVWVYYFDFYLLYNLLVFFDQIYVYDFYVGEIVYVDDSFGVLV